MRKLGSLLVLAALAWAGWYGYSYLGSPSSDRDEHPAQQGRFNCRQALAKHADESACLASAACRLSDAELADMQQREADIEQHCN